MKFQTQNPAVTVDHRAIRNELYRTLEVCRKASREGANLQATMKNIQKIIKRSKSQPSNTRKGQ